eukprot:m.135028 g.135028  ORF g.135028 m.135028 type:complete len:488 (+) comp15835_c0_seq1:101-1564(+)
MRGVTLVVTALLCLAASTRAARYILPWAPNVDPAEFHITINLGDVVIFENVGNTRQTITEINEDLSFRFGGLDVASFEPGERYRRVFKRPAYKPGVYYFVSLFDFEVLRGSITILPPLSTTVTTTTMTTTQPETTTTTTTSTTTTTTAPVATIPPFATDPNSTMIGPSVAPQDILFCGEGWLLRGDECYTYVTPRADSGYLAALACEAEAAHLAIITNVDETIWVRDLIQANQDWIDPFIGLFYEPLEGGFFWVDRTSPIYEHWRSQDLSGAVGCVAAAPFLAGGSWQTVDCFERRPYICQKPAGVRHQYAIHVNATEIQAFGPETVVDLVGVTMESCLKACDENEACKRLVITKDPSNQFSCIGDSNNGNTGSTIVIPNLAAIHVKLQPYDLPPPPEIMFAQTLTGAVSGIDGSIYDNALSAEDTLLVLFAATVQDCEDRCRQLQTCVGFVRGRAMATDPASCSLLARFGNVVSTSEELDTYEKQF